MKTVARLDPRDCPEGIVFRSNEPDQSIEQRCFPGWENVLTTPPHCGTWRQFCVLREHDSGRKVIEHVGKDNGCLLTGADDWTDCTVEAAVRQFLDVCLPGDDDERTLIARTGIVFRQQTVRRYYWFGLEGFDRFVLYRRRTRPGPRWAPTRLPSIAAGTIHCASPSPARRSGVMWMARVSSKRRTPRTGRARSVSAPARWRASPR